MFTLSKTFSTVALILTGILPGHSQESEPLRESSQLIQSIEDELDALHQERLNLTNSHPDSGYGILTIHRNEDDQILRIANNLKTQDGGSIKTIFYFKSSGQLIAKSEVSRYPGESPTWHFTENTTFFRNNAMQAERNRSAEYRSDAPFNPASIPSDIIPSTEFDRSWVTESYEDAMIRSEQIERLVANFHGKAGLPSNLLLDSVSPAGNFGVCWKEENPDEFTASYYLADLQNHFESVVELGTGLQPGANHAYQWTVWSDEGRHFVFGMDGKWTTIDAYLYTISEGRSITQVGNLYQDATEIGWNALVEDSHPFTQEGDGLFGSIRIASIENPTRVHLVLNTESKFEGPENNVCSEMVLSYANDGTVEKQFFRTKDFEAPLAFRPGEPAAPQASEPFAILTNRGVGPIDSETPFHIKEIRKLFPENRVVAATETFEEGGETPVIHVIHEGEAVITLVPKRDQAKLGWVYTTSRKISTQLGFSPGDTFGEIFDTIPPETYLEGISGEVLAEVPGMPALLFRFEPHDPAATDTTELPPYESLKDWFLYTIEWTPEP